MSGADRSQLDRHVTGAAASHQRLLTHLDQLAADAALDPRRPSLLPDWTVGHVLTHLARNADSHIRMLEGATAGEVRDQYVGGAAGRTREIDDGAGRASDELVDDVRSTIWRLEQVWATQPTWQGHGRSVSQGLMPIDDLPFRRWRETEVHHVDLGLDGYGVDDWPPDYIRRELARMEMLWDARLPMGMTGLPPEALAAPPARRLAWLLGRADIDGLPDAGVFG